MNEARVAAVQMASGPRVDANLSRTEGLIAQAAQGGAELIVLPENFAIMGKSPGDSVTVAESVDGGPIQDFLAAQARRHKVWLVGGTVPLRGPTPQRTYASSLLYNAAGEQVARYDKIHLFDVIVQAGEGREAYRESETIEPGQKVVTADTPFGRIGLAVCYDLRFPELFRALATQGVELLVLPAAFTATTGKAHWRVLCRARAIENLCYLVAAGQGGYHVSGRETHGESLIIDPWGTVLAELDKGPGVIVGDLDRGRQAQLRRNFPAIDHMRFECKLT